MHDCCFQNVLVTVLVLFKCYVYVPMSLVESFLLEYWHQKLGSYLILFELATRSRGTI